MRSTHQPQQSPPQRTLPVGDHTARNILHAAKAISTADALLITAGAGMSADSGLPVFRGNDGFWRAYPPLAVQRISFERMAQPLWFATRPRMAWAFYGHRLQLYREAEPHAGHAILRTWGARAAAGGSFVVTSNVDGQFLKAGFAAESVAEQHGSIHRLQCQQPCADETWDTAPAAADDLAIDLDALEARGMLPVCPRCGQTARPNILMFNDTAWVDAATRAQMQAFERWKSAVRGLRLVIVEIGAGTAIPTIRRIGERAAERARTTLVRINPEEAHDSAENALVVPLPALQALTLIDEAMNGTGGGGAGRGNASRKNPKRESNAPPFQLLLPSRQMATVDPPVAAVPAARRRQTTVLPTALRAIHYVELHSGYTQVIDPKDLLPAELGYCLEQWHRAAQGRSMPLPVLRGLALEGYAMRGQVVVVASGNEAVGGAASGAALLQINDPRGELVVSVGFARRAREGAYLWRRLLEEASVAVQPTDYPQEPWIVRRVEPAARRNAAMMGALGFVEYAIGVAWLRRVNREE